MPQLSAEAKHHIVLEYRAHTPNHSFAALAARHSIAGGAQVVCRWHQRWDGTAASLQRKEGGVRPRALNSREVQQHVRTPILRANRAHKAVHYTALLPSVRAKTGKEVSLQTLRRYGKEELEAKQRKGKKRTADECECTQSRKEGDRCLLHAQPADLVACVFRASAVSSDMCEQIAKVRRKLQRTGTGHILFLDETLKREGDVDSYSIFLPGQPPYIESSSTSANAARFDMIACCSGKTVRSTNHLLTEGEAEGNRYCHAARVHSQPPRTGGRSPRSIPAAACPRPRFYSQRREDHAGVSRLGLSGADTGDQDATRSSKTPLTPRQLSVQPLEEARTGAWPTHENEHQAKDERRMEHNDGGGDSCTVQALWPPTPPGCVLRLS
jgi:hypothetical protein